jgi:triosephosphate isomerase (TIM)
VAFRKFVVGNWKMNGSLAALTELDAIAAAASEHRAVEVAICPPATLIAPMRARQPNLLIGAQDCHAATSGAHTGCLSVAMLAEAGAQLVIVGHSERRSDNFETDFEVKAKASAAIQGGLIAIVCVGESEAQRDAGDAIDVVRAQLYGSIPLIGSAANLVVAYEPVWAIGTGRTPKISDVADMHRAIRAKLAAQLGDEGRGVRILYGGSVKPSNAAEFMAITDVNGALVGGASLTSADFIPIIASAG